MSNIVFNNRIGSAYSFEYPKLTKEQERVILAGLFEQLLLFDKITISTNSLNFQLIFLLNTIGINKVEELIEKDIIKFLLWTPVIVSSSGKVDQDGIIDESAIYGTFPIGAGSLSDEDRDPENNIEKALSLFNLNRDRKRIFKRLALKNYIIPDGMEFSVDSAKLVIDAYEQNNLRDLGLPYETEPEQLNLQKRILLLELGHKVLETAILSKYGLKSFENYEHYKICEQNLRNIGDALRVSENTSEILKIENIPNLKDLYLSENFDINSAMNLRYKSNAKYFRKWINEISESCDATEISREYINEIKGNNRFFETVEGKVVKNILMFGIHSALGATIAGPIGAVAGLGLGMLETFWLDSIFKGKNPSMFIDSLQMERENVANNEC